MLRTVLLGLSLMCIMFSVGCDTAPGTGSIGPSMTIEGTLSATKESKIKEIRAPQLPGGGGGGGGQPTQPGK
jgi:hypothetical protein